MFRRSLAGLVMGGLVAAAASAQTVGELIAKNNQAEGGRSLRSMKTARLSGTADGSPLLMEFAPPSHKVRMEVTTKDEIDINAYDGKAGWQVKPSEGKTEPEKLTGDALKDMKEMADFQGPLFDYEAKGHEIEYLGKGEIDGTPVYKLRLTRHDGEESTIYLDAKSYLEIREETVHGSRNDRTELVTTYGNWKTVDGVTLPSKIETKSKETLGGGMIRMEGSVVIVIDKIELNVEIPDSRFARPEHAGG